jgi:hypothetical protein
MAGGRFGRLTWAKYRYHKPRVFGTDKSAFQMERVGGLWSMEVLIRGNTFSNSQTIQSNAPPS